MRWTRFIAALVALFAMTAVFAGLSYSKPAAKPASDMVKRGEYLVTIAGCNDCHTPGNLYGQPDFSRRLSGSELGWTGPWGVAFPRNLTPDPETGLGKWSDDEIVTAIRTGQRPDGRMLAPFMPYAGFSHLTDDDAHAIVAYLRSLPPISHHVPDVVPPGEKYDGAVMTFPAPPAWDVPPPPANDGK